MKLFASTDMGPEEVEISPKGKSFQILFTGCGRTYTIRRVTLAAINRAIEDRAYKYGEMNWKVYRIVDTETDHAREREAIEAACWATVECDENLED